MADLPKLKMPNMPAASHHVVPPSSPVESTAFEPFDCVRKLTHDLVKRGWREAFSATANRPYYYNIFTRESVWSIPEVMPIQREQRQLEIGPAPDMLAAAMAELSGESLKAPVGLQAAPFIKGKQASKRKFSPDPDQEENDKNAVKFHLGDRDDNELMETKRRVRVVIKAILTKIVSDRIFDLTYKAQQQLGCEGCEEDWPSQFDHTCMFYGYAPECRLQDFIPEHYDEAIQIVDATKVRLVFGLVTSRLGVGPFTYQDMNLENVINDVLEEWKTCPDDISYSFYSNFLNMLTELVNDAMQKLKF